MVERACDDFYKCSVSSYMSGSSKHRFNSLLMLGLLCKIWKDLRCFLLFHCFSLSKILTPSQLILCPPTHPRSVTALICVFLDSLMDKTTCFNIYFANYTLIDLQWSFLRLWRAASAPEPPGGLTKNTPTVDPDLANSGHLSLSLLRMKPMTTV